MIRLLDLQNRPVGEAVSNMLRRITKSLSEPQRDMENVLRNETKKHVQRRYPGSNHYSPDRIHNGSITKNSASIDINIPGITRAYHDILIRPKFRQRLTIPLHQSAYGKKARSFSDLFYIRNKNGKEFLAKYSGNQLILMYVLAKSAFQKQDSTLMPTDESYSKSIFARIVKTLNNS